jgi:DNA-binding MarR family transcriptional regulator
MVEPPTTDIAPPSPPSIGFLLQRAHHLLRDRMTAELEGSGLHLGHVALLGAMLDAPGLSQRELSLRTGIEKSSMVIFVDALEHDGWVRRAPHPTDRRAHALFVTAEGATRLAEVGPRLRQAEEDFLAALSAAERDVLRSSLTKLVSRGA